MTFGQSNAKGSSGRSHEEEKKNYYTNVGSKWNKTQDHVHE